MTAEISRDLLVERLGAVKYDRFLFYLMGPYKSFNLEYVLDEEERRDIDTADLPGPLRRLFRNKADIDAEVDIDRVDAVTQSIEYARCSNATAFVVPFLGHNFGVGEEAGSVLENLADTHGDRLVFVHDSDVTSAMIRSASVRWDLRVETYDTEAELVDKLRVFAGGVMHRERRGDLDRLD